MDRQSRIVAAFAQSVLVKQQTLELLLPRLSQAAGLLVDAYSAGHKAIFMGNGGSAADAQHLAAEMLGRIRRDRRPLPALALHANSSALTAIANDFGFEQSYLRPMQALAAPGDVVVALSTSGNSPNVLAALQWARSVPLASIALTGAGGGAMRGCVDVLLDVPSREVPRIQECHILLGHVLCELVETELCD